MAGTALAFGSRDSTARLLHPFRRLRRGKMRFVELFYEPLGEAAIAATFHSVRKRYVALPVTLLTSLVSPALTIVTSGLFTATTVAYQSPQPLNPLDWPVVEDRGNSQSCNKEASLVMDALSFNNLSYPRWTYDDLVFPQVSLDASRGDIALSSTTWMVARLPRIWHRTNCHVHAFYIPANLSISYCGADNATYQMNIDPPQGCHPFIYDNGTSSPLVLRGKMYNVGATQYIGDLVQPSAYEGAVQQKSSACQRLLFAVAARVAHRRLQDTTILRCAPYAQAIYTTVNLTLPDLDLDTSASPHMPNANGPIQETTNVTRTPDLAYQCKGMDAQAQYANASLDPFVAAATLGQDGVPAADLVGPANADRLIARLEKVYAQMLSQAYHFAYRESVASPGIGASFTFDILAPPFNGTITANKERLVQSAVATKIIESILAVMAVCAVLHCALTWGEERVVPRDPGSVAAKMSFWAGSEVVKRIAAAMEFGEKDWKECFEGEVLGLRWWEREGEDGTGGRGFGIDVGVPAAGKEE